MAPKGNRFSFLSICLDNAFCAAHMGKLTPSRVKGRGQFQEKLRTI